MTDAVKQPPRFEDSTRFEDWYPTANIPAQEKPRAFKIWQAAYAAGRASQMPHKYRHIFSKQSGCCLRCGVPQFDASGVPTAFDCEGQASRPPREFEHDEDYPCFGDSVEHSRDCKNCDCQAKDSPPEYFPGHAALLQQARDLCAAIERLPASSHQTNLSIYASTVAHALQQLQREGDYFGNELFDAHVLGVIS